MITSTETTEINKALIEVNRQIINIVGNQLNPHYNSKYADLSALLETLKPALCENGLVIIQTVSSSPLEQHIQVTTRVTHISGQFYQDSAGAPAYKETTKGRTYNVQTVGSAITYFRRAQIKCCFAIAEVDDDGNSNVPDKAKKEEDSINPTLEEISVQLKNLNYEQSKTYYKELMIYKWGNITLPLMDEIFRMHAETVKDVEAKFKTVAKKEVKSIQGDLPC